MKWLNEFKTFAMRGNVLDMAVGIIIGGAFGKIVPSLVADVMMPPVGMPVGGIHVKAVNAFNEKKEAAPPETRNSKPETRNSKPETRNSKPETRNLL